MSTVAASDRLLEYRLTKPKRKRLKSHRLIWLVLKRGVISMQWYAGALVVAVVAVGVEFLRPLPTAIIVGSILPLIVDVQESSDALVSICIAWVLLEAVRVTVSILYEYLGTEGSFNLMLHLRRRFLGDMEEMNEETREGLGLGRLYTTYNNDLPAYVQFYRDFVPSVLSNLITVVATFLVIYLLSSAIFMFLILVIPLQVLVSSFFRSRMKTAQRRHSRYRDEGMSLFNESLANSELIKSFDAVERISDLTMTKVEAMIAQNRRIRTQRIVWQAVSTLVSTGFTVGIALLAGLQVIEGAISLTFFLVINAYAQKALDPILALIRSGQRIIPLMVSVQWSEEFFGAAEQEVHVPRDHKAPISARDIEFRHVTFRYPDTPASARPALEDVSFHLDPGQMIVLCGASGCGKSTVLKLLRGNLEAQEGQVLIGGVDVRLIDRKSLSRLMAYLSQRVALLSMSLLQNAELLSPDSSEADLRTALRMARVLDEIEEMEQEVRVEVDDAQRTTAQKVSRFLFGVIPERVELLERREGLDRMAGLSGNLSGGQQQRVSIGFSLLSQCPVLLFDEPTSGLDKFAENELVDTIAALAEQDRTVMVVAHTLAPYFSLPDEKVYFVFLHEGRLVGSGQRRELLETCPGFRALARENVRHVLALDRADLELMRVEGNLP